MMIEPVCDKDDVAHLDEFLALVVAWTGIVHVCEVVKTIFVHFVFLLLVEIRPSAVQGLTGER